MLKLLREAQCPLSIAMLRCLTYSARTLSFLEYFSADPMLMVASQAVAHVAGMPRTLGGFHRENFFLVRTILPHEPHSQGLPTGKDALRHLLARRARRRAVLNAERWDCPPC
jgi:hypothetical protein